MGRTSPSDRERPRLPTWAHIGEKRLAHVTRVTALLESWADALEVPSGERNRWLRAAWLHDALKDAPRRMIRELARGVWEAPSLWHGPAAAERAAREGERDQGVLDAVRYHSVGYAGWDGVGRMLYLADYLEPGRRSRARLRAERASRVVDDMEGVLRIVAAERIAHGIDKGWPLLPETVAFWNALV